MPGADQDNHGVRKLVVYERSMELVEAAYRLTKLLPDSEQFGLSSQIRRAATSIPLNIAEGYGRQHRRDYVRFLAIARGSASEVDTALEIALRLDMVTPENVEDARNRCLEVIKMLSTMMRRLGE